MTTPHPGRWLAFVAAVVLFGAALPHAQSRKPSKPPVIVTIEVPATGNLWLAGQPDGTVTWSNDVAPDQSPTRISLKALGNPKFVTFASTGSVQSRIGGFGFGYPLGALCTPDGLSCQQPYVTWSSCQGGSPGVPWGYVTDVGGGGCALIGVFLNTANLQGGEVIPFAFGPAYSFLTATNGRAFLIGDGLSSCDPMPEGGGGASCDPPETAKVQVYVVPPGATELYLAPRDGGGHDSPSWDNVGAYTVTITGYQTRPNQ